MMFVGRVDRSAWHHGHFAYQGTEQRCLSRTSGAFETKRYHEHAVITKYFIPVITLKRPAGNNMETSTNANFRSSSKLVG